MIYFLIWCVIGIGIIGLFVKVVTKRIIEEFRVKHNLEKKKVGFFKKIGNFFITLICFFTPIVQVFIIAMLFVTIGGYSSKNEEVIETLKSKW